MAKKKLHLTRPKLTKFVGAYKEIVNAAPDEGADAEE